MEAKGNGMVHTIPGNRDWNYRNGLRSDPVCYWIFSVAI